MKDGSKKEVTSFDGGGLNLFDGGGYEIFAFDKNDDIWSCYQKDIESVVSTKTNKVFRDFGNDEMNDHPYYLPESLMSKPV
jgi:hypothetical protein